MVKLLVDRKAYSRKGFDRKTYHRKDGTRVEGSHVDPAHVPRSRFRIKDRGKKGRGEKVLPKLKKGSLGVNFHQSAEARHRIEMAKARKLGERRVGGKLRAVQVLNKRTNPTVSKKAASDARYVFKHIGKYNGE